MAKKYLLLDANVTAAYYLPKSISSTKVRDRIEVIFNSIRSGASDHFLYIPNFVIAEVFNVFMKYSFGGWNVHVKKPLDTRIYNSLVKQFQTDIHNGKFITQYELNRYHILGVNLVAPVDHSRQITRPKTVKGKKRTPFPMGTFDQLIVSMSVQLGKLHGVDNVAIITADKRLSEVVRVCRGGLKAATIKKLKLDSAEETTGFKFSPSIFPTCLHLTHANKSDLKEFFDEWPLREGTVPKHYRYTKL